MVMCDIADRTMCLVNEDMDVTGADFAKEMTKPPFGKVIPIMNLQEDGVANGHCSPLYPYGVSTMVRLSPIFRLAPEIGSRKQVRVLNLPNMVSTIGGETDLRRLIAGYR